MGEPSVLDDVGGTVLNSASFGYGGYQQLTSASQDLGMSGGVKQVTYAWDTASTNRFRLAGMTYPDQGGVTVGYGTTGSLNDLLSRLESVDGPGAIDLVDYRYMGTRRLVGLTLGNGIARDYDDGSGGAVDGLDGFGRAVDMLYEAGSTPMLRYHYGYDQRGNRTYARITRQGQKQSWLYEYDPLDRLIRASRGNLNDNGDGFIGDAETIRWDLDPLGNWSGGDSSDSLRRFIDVGADGEYDAGTDTMLGTDHHVTNELNEIASRVTGGAGGPDDPEQFVYDAAGNLVFD